MPLLYLLIYLSIVIILSLITIALAKFTSVFVSMMFYLVLASIILTINDIFFAQFVSNSSKEYLKYIFNALDSFAYLGNLIFYTLFNCIGIFFKEILTNFNDNYFNFFENNFVGLLYLSISLILFVIGIFISIKRSRNKATSHFSRYDY